MATIGLRDVYYALLKEDPVGGTPTYETPVKIAGAISANVNPNSSSATLFADDGPYDTAATLGEISLELNMADLPLSTQATLLGHSISNGVLSRKADDVPPWVAVGFRTLKSNGKYRYYWLNKGKFAIPEDDLQTKGDSIEFQTPTISGSFVKRNSDDEWQRVGDEDEESFSSEGWFSSPLATGQAPSGGGGGTGDSIEP